MPEEKSGVRYGFTELGFREARTQAEEKLRGMEKRECESQTEGG